MKSKLQKLYKKYPKILDRVPFECGDGWYNLLAHLCDQLQFDIDRNDYQQIKFTQIKEKFGTLRAYFNWDYMGSTERALTESAQRKMGCQEGAVHFAELLSSSICEVCGSHEGKKYIINYWHYTRCPECAKKLKAIK